MSNSRQSSDTTRGIWLTVVAVVAVASLLVGGFFYSFLRDRMMSEDELKANGAFLYDKPRLLPEFELLDDRGESFGPDSFKGQWSLVFFGYTFCPDVCPTTLAQLKQFYDSLEPALQKDTRIILATVDPARDTVEQLHNYVGFFHPDFRGLTGDFLEIHRLATALNTPFAKVPGGGDNYLVDHGGNIAIVNPRGYYVGFFRGPVDVLKLKRVYPSVRAVRS